MILKIITFEFSYDLEKQENTDEESLSCSSPEIGNSH